MRTRLALDMEVAEPTIPEEEIYNPYKGLRAFQEADADDFFGRESLIKQLLDAEDIDTKRWLQGAAFTVTRAGFILSDSLETAARIVTQEGDASIAVPYKDRLRDLIAYSVSDPYMRVRRELGFGR